MHINLFTFNILSSALDQSKSNLILHKVHPQNQQTLRDRQHNCYE